MFFESRRTRGTRILVSESRITRITRMNADKIPVLGLLVWIWVYV